MLLSDDYRRQLIELHRREANWGHGHQAEHLPKILEHIPRKARVLDYGCGKGNLVQAMKENGYFAHGYDPGVAEWSKVPLKGTYDWVVSFDVMEHIEPELVPEVVAHLVSTADHGIVEIALLPAAAILPDGRNAHLSLFPADVWRAMFPESAVVTAQKRSLLALRW